MTAALSPLLVEPTQLPDADRGAVSLQEGRPGYYWVRGSEMVYEVFLRGDTGRCECPSYRYRQRCAHLHAVRLYLWRERVCPICEGKGWLHPHPGSGFRYADRRGGYNDKPLPLACCDGTGLRCEYEKHPTGWEIGQNVDVYCPTPAVPRPEAKR